MANYYLLCSNYGFGKSELTSFDNALLSSGIANYNLVKVSSILPSNAIKKNKVDIPEGSVLYTAYASKTSIKQGEKISAAIAVGIPKNTKSIGVIMEYSGYCNKNEAKRIVEEMVAEAMKNRGYDIKEIQSKSSEAISDGNQFVTAFAALAMWKS